MIRNAFPYWQGVAVEQGADSLMKSYDIVVSKAQGKTVRISETGWPSAGDNYGASVPSPENQKLYLQNVLCVTRQRGIDLMYFSAIDEPYKGGVEAYWGIMDSNRQLKPTLSTSLFANPC
jgi:glucan 1,3-beta-glucosidase